MFSYKAAADTPLRVFESFLSSPTLQPPIVLSFKMTSKDTLTCGRLDAVHASDGAAILVKILSSILSSNRRFGDSPRKVSRQGSFSCALEGLSVLSSNITWNCFLQSIPVVSHTFGWGDSCGVPVLYEVAKLHTICISS
jgi:hypothetical protein